MDSQLNKELKALALILPLIPIAQLSGGWFWCLSVGQGDHLAAPLRVFLLKSEIPSLLLRILLQLRLLELRFQFIIVHRATVQVAISQTKLPKSLPGAVLLEERLDQQILSSHRQIQTTSFVRLILGVSQKEKLHVIEYLHNKLQSQLLPHRLLIQLLPITRVLELSDITKTLLRLLQVRPQAPHVSIVPLSDLIREKTSRACLEVQTRVHRLVESERPTANVGNQITKTILVKIAHRHRQFRQAISSVYLVQKVQKHYLSSYRDPHRL